MNKNYLAPKEIVEAVINVGKAKAENRFLPLLILGILAGAFIAFAAQGSSMAAFNLLLGIDTFGLGRALAGAVFTVGLMLVIVTGAELFTGNTLICLAVYEKKVTIGGMLRNWGIVYVGNLIGALIIVFMVAQTGLLHSNYDELGRLTVTIALNKVNMSFGAALFSGILCNWLVCLAVWMATAANSVTGKLLAAFFPIWLFATSGFEHCVANMYYIPAGILAKAQYGGFWEPGGLDSLNWGTFFTGNLIPATIGNIIGGVLFVGTAYWLALYRTSKKSKKTQGGESVESYD